MENQKKKGFRIPFSHNWNNKLGGEIKIFTTIRKWTKDKEEHYRAHIGQEGVADLNGQPPLACTLLYVETKIFRTLPQALLMMDTGAETVEAAKKVFMDFGIKDDDLVLLLVLSKNETK